MKKITAKTMCTSILLCTSLLFCACDKKPEIEQKNYGEKRACVYEPKTFSVGLNKYVYFSQGNLQYQASTGIWQFAENQYDIIGNDNEGISSSFSGWIDLFGWGTSGWNSGAKTYMPYSTDSCSLNYNPGGVSECDFDLIGDILLCDWGVYNKISNGGNAANLWRTLTKEEWAYILTERPRCTELFSAGKIGGMNGLILLPDEWEQLESIPFTADTALWEANDYTFAEWAEMEANGAVFLPAAGFREGTSTQQSIWNEGLYWSSSASTEERAWHLHFYGLGVVCWDHPRAIGHSVRLVQNVAPSQE